MSKSLSSTKPSKDAISKMVYHDDTIEAKEECSIFVKVSDIRRSQYGSCFYTCQLSDEEFEVNGLIYLPSRDSAESMWKLRHSLLKVNGYITSAGNVVLRSISDNQQTRKNNVSRGGDSHRQDTNEFLLCIVSFDIVEQEEYSRTDSVPVYSNSENEISKKLPSLPNRSKIPGSRIAMTMRELSFCFTEEELVGISNPNNDANRIKEKCDQISSFITNHKAIIALQQNMSWQRNASQTGEEWKEEVNASDNYIKAVTEFSEAQITRQISSLDSANSVPNSKTALDQYITSIKHAVENAQSGNAVDMALLSKLHRTLGESIIEDAGEIRKKQVRAGKSIFTPIDDVKSQLDEYVSLLRDLEDKMSYGNSSVVSKGLGLVLFASVALFVLCDIHPFLDGNGRLARIMSNFAMIKCGLPFVVNIFATPLQRSEYIRALQITRRNARMASVGLVSPNVFSLLRRQIGVMGPIFNVILDRMSKACAECQEVIQEKNKLESENLEAVAAKKFREKAAAGNCLICMDENPNIATLCCGKAVHINCMAKWLSNRLECPHCRYSLPSLPAQDLSSSAQVDPPQVHIFPPYDTETTTTDDTTSSSMNDDLSQTYESTTTDTMEETAVDDAPVVQEVSESQIGIDEDDTRTDVMDDTTTDVMDDTDIFEDTTTTEDDDIIDSSGVQDETIDDTTTIEFESDGVDYGDGEDHDTSSDTMNGNESRHSHMTCYYYGCRNKPAANCSTNACGSCCVQFNPHGCYRHNVS